MKKYIFKISMCDGKFCDGTVSVIAESEEEAAEKVASYVGERLYEALPELNIEYSWELETEMEVLDDEIMTDEQYYEYCIEKSKECLKNLLSEIESPLGIELAGILADAMVKIEKI